MGEKDWEMTEVSSSGCTGLRLVQLAARGDWLTLEQTLRALETGDARLSHVDQESGLSLLMIAVRENRLSVVDKLLELGANPNERTKDGRTVLHVAAAHSKDEVVRLLVKRADPNVPGGVGAHSVFGSKFASADLSKAANLYQIKDCFEARGWPPWHPSMGADIPVLHRQKPDLRQLPGPARNILMWRGGKPKDQLPLHCAASRPTGGTSTVQTLLKFSSKDARLLQDKEGNIPLFLAVEAGNVAIVKELLGALAEPQLRTQRKVCGDAALHISSRRKDMEMIKLLVEHGAVVDMQNDDGQTSLHIAATEADDLMLKFFYQCKANPNIVDKLDRLPLHMAAERGHTTVVEVLIEKFKSNVLARTKDGNTLMHVASQCGHPETALLFLKKGVPLHMPNKLGAVCLHAAAGRGHTAVVKALLQKGAHVDATSKDGCTALHLATQSCKPLVVQMLLGFGAQVELKGGKAKETPLHIAARVKEGEKVAEMLLKSGANVDAEQENGETAMHLAARHGNLQMIQALIEEGGDLIYCSKAGENPLHIAVRHCHAHVVQEILTYLANERSLHAAQLCVIQENKEGETSLHLAAKLQKEATHSEGEDTSIIRTLMEYDAGVTVATRETGETPLHYCARVGNTEVLQEILSSVRPNELQLAVNKHAKNGWSPLLVAAERGHTEIVKVLLQNSARVDVFDEQGKAALHLAVEHGHEDIADILLSHKAFVNAKTKLGLTPLHLGAQSGSSRLLCLLVETHQASINALSLKKQTPLHLAAVSGQLDVCNSLLNMRADVNACDMHGQTPLHLAAENDHSDVVKLFLKHQPELASLANADGATCAHIAASKGSVAVIRELLKFNRGGVMAAKTKTDGLSPLHLAASGGHTEVVKVLLEAGAPAVEENSEGMTAVHLAAQNGHTHLLEVLKGCVSFKISSSKTGLTALHIAASFGQLDFVREILTKVPATLCSTPSSGGSSRDGMIRLQQGTESGYTPLHMAAQSGHESLVRLLLNYPGVQPDAQTALQGSTPLHLAAQRGHTAVVGLLLSRSSSLLHLRDKRGRTGLHLAAANGHLGMVRVLLGQGAEINHTDKNGWTALHYAAKSGCLVTVHFMVESGASARLECKEGRTPIQYAAEENHQSTVNFLLRQGSNTHRLLEDRKFIFDLMVCGKLNGNQVVQDFVLHSVAPLDTAVKLSRAFGLVALREKERSVDLLSASMYCEAMAAELLTLASGRRGAATVLQAVDLRGISMLDCFIESQQKVVVAHPAVQQYLTEVWHGGLGWSSWKMTLMFTCLLLCPPLWLVLSLPLRQRFNYIPILKFMSHLVSHIFLLLLFILTIVYPPINPICLGHLVPDWSEWLLLIWLCGMLMSEVTQPGDRAGLACIRILMLVFSLFAFFCHLMAIGIQPPHHFYCLFARNLLLAVAMTLSFLQLLEFLTFHHLFGPWAIVIRDLMKDLGRFAVILVLFHTAFTMNLSAVYQPVYPVGFLSSPEGNNDTELQTPLQISIQLFFALFGLIEPDSLPPPIRSPPIAAVFTQVVFGIYLVVTVIVLINLLIAMMSDTYQRIQAQSDIEWKFGRAVLIRDMNRKSGPPSPFNLFTSLFFYVKVLCRHGGKICSSEARGYRTEGEDLEGISDSRSLHMLPHSSAGWLRSNKRTQILPDGGLSQDTRPGGLVRVEDVADWQAITERYLAVRGQKAE